MKKVLLLSKDMNFCYRLNNIYDKKELSITLGDISYQEAYNYIYKGLFDIIVIHSSFINSNYQIFDKLIQTKKWIVIFASNKMEIGLLYNVMSSPRFYIMNESKIEGFNDVCYIMNKNINLIDNYEAQVEKLKEKVDEDQVVKKAKLHLINEHKYSEDEAYKMILKRAMDKRISKKQAAYDYLNE